MGCVIHYYADDAHIDVATAAAWIKKGSLLL